MKPDMSNSIESAIDIDFLRGIDIGIDIDFSDIGTIDIGIDIDFSAFGKLALALTLTFFRFNVNGVKTHQILPVLSKIKGNASSNHNQNKKNDESIQFTCVFEARFHEKRQIIDTSLDIGIDIEPKHWTLTLKLALIRG